MEKLGGISSLLACEDGMKVCSEWAPIAHGTYNLASHDSELTFEQVKFLLLVSLQLSHFWGWEVFQEGKAVNKVGSRMQALDNPLECLLYFDDFRIRVSGWGLLSVNH